MSRLKLESISALEKANTRLASLKSIDENLDLGTDKSVANYSAQIIATTNAAADYNSLLSKVDDAGIKVKAAIKNLNSWSESMLDGVGFVYGKDSNEYQMAGGTRKSDIKRAPRKKKDS